MKKWSAVFVCAALLMCTTGFAQNNFIIRAGFVSSNPKKTPVYGEASPRSGIYAGVAYEASLTELFSFQPELLYVQKGEDWASGLTVTYKSRINYLEVPLLLKVKLPSNKVLAYFNAGPSLGFALSGQETGGAFSFSGTRAIEFGNADDQLSAVDIAAQFGAGLGYRIGRGSVLADVRYGLGLHDLSNSRNSTYKSRALMIGLGFSLPL